jgi:alanine racemase
VFRSLHDEVVLLKGARRFGFERISELLEQRVHETILEVDLNAVVNNLNHYRSMMKPGTKLVCMIKADAYGAGAVEIAKTLQDQRVDYLAVATADEGAELRRAGITQNVIVMNPEMSSFKTLFDYDLEPEVYSFRLLDALVAAARQQGITGWPVHIKLDTGMHRLGFNAIDHSNAQPMVNGQWSMFNEIDELINRLKHQSAIIPRSVFTHFVGSDSDDFDNFSALQFQRFDCASRQLQAAFNHKILRHICNSAGIEHFPERQLDMCRLGIGLYGVEPLSEKIKAKSEVLDHYSSLQCVSTLKTTILQIRNVPKSETVGYSRKGVLTRDSRIAALPIGYADGLDRLLGNRHGYCIVNGQKAEYVGNICMDVALIDVTDIPCEEGDPVEIFGRQLPVTVLSDILGTIPYEVFTSVSNRVKRVYFRD